MSWLFPPKKDFLEMLANQAAKSEEGLAALSKFLHEPTAANARVVKQLEEEADELRRVLMDELHRTFITSLDREDIYILSKTIDDVIDYADTTAEEMVLFGIKRDAHIQKMVDLLHAAAKDILLAVRSVEKYRGVCAEHLSRVRKAENNIEKIYRSGLAELFKSKDLVRILKTREVYRHLSNAADRAVEAANILGSILVKKS